MPRHTNDYPHIKSYRLNDEIKVVIEQFADENELGKSEALRRLVQYGILYYYYEKDKMSGND